MISCVNQRNCHTISCNYDEVEKLILSTLRSWLKGYTIKLDTVGYEREIEDYQQKIKQLEKERAKLEAQLDKAFTLVEQGIYTISVFNERRSKLESDIETIEAQIKRLQDSIASMIAESSAQSLLIPKTQSLLDNYDTMTALERNKLLKEILVKITYNKTESGEIQLDIYPRISSFLE